VRQLRDFEAGSDRRFGQAARLRTARELGLFNGGGYVAVFDDCGGSVAEDSADSENVHKV
jgi:hypothetical protein